MLNGYFKKGLKCAYLYRDLPVLSRFPDNREYFFNLILSKLLASRTGPII